jgi:hypothetical protein
MPRKRLWTAEEDRTLAAERAARRSWDHIGAALRASRSAVIDRAHRIGVPRLPPIPPRRNLADPNRDALPAGDPIAWAVLTERTLLAAAPYPFPPLD